MTERNGLIGLLAEPIQIRELRARFNRTPRPVMDEYEVRAIEMYALYSMQADSLSHYSTCSIVHESTGAQLPI